MLPQLPTAASVTYAIREAGLTHGREEHRTDAAPGVAFNT
jgi:hypothetical protein